MSLTGWRQPPLVTDRHEELSGEVATATFSPDRTYRYTLTRTWGDSPPAVWVMCNPSTADAFKVDPTIRRCMTFSKAWHAGGIIVLNLFALRSTDPKNLYTHGDPIGLLNDDVIAGYFPVDVPVLGPVVAAWGAHGTHRNRGHLIRRLLIARGARPLCLGLTKAGQPRHPLYIPNGTAAFELPAIGPNRAQEPAHA